MTPTYSKQQLREFPWIVSSDTLRLSDLTVACASALATIEGIVGSTTGTVTDADTRLFNVAANLSRKIVEGAAPKTKEKLLDLTDTLVDALSEYAPLGCYFGAHPGDGSCFGFWIEEDLSRVLTDLGFPEEPIALVPLLQELEAAGVDVTDWPWIVGSWQHCLGANEPTT